MKAILAAALSVLMVSFAMADSGASQPKQSAANEEDRLYGATSEEGPTGDYVTNLPRALEYLERYPHGKHAVMVHAELAFLYTDIAKVLMGMRDGEPMHYKSECYSEYATNEPMNVQIERARNEAIKHLHAALKMNPPSDIKKMLEYYLADYSAGEIPSTWVGCTD